MSNVLPFWPPGRKSILMNPRGTFEITEFPNGFRIVRQIGSAGANPLDEMLRLGLVTKASPA